MKLIDHDLVVGIFRGFTEGGLEFHADLVLPYRADFQATPMHGQFMIVELESEDEGVLGRITSLSAQGRLVSAAGEDYSVRAVQEDRPIAEDLREQYLRYEVDIRVLGVLRQVRDQVVFAPSHRRLPHVGSRVAFLGPELMQVVAGARAGVDAGAELGFMALGEFIYSGEDGRLSTKDWMRVTAPTVTPRFPVEQLVSRRTFVFARAGFGKSNLVKLLFSRLYAGDRPPSVVRRGGRRAPVGTVIFDPDGEYFWPDDQGRPGLCDVRELRDRVVVFTDKDGPSAFYSSFIAGRIKLDIRRLRPSDVVAIALPPERQDQQNVKKLRGLGDDRWRKLVDLIYEKRLDATPEEVGAILGLDRDRQDVEALAARSNMVDIVRQLHDPSSVTLQLLLRALEEGRLCVVDVSRMRGQAGRVLAGILLRQIFNHNQDEFTKAEPRSIPTIAVIEEAQTVLGGTEGKETAQTPFVEWVKEGRKYGLGAVLVTQQPGAISHELLSQGDNWFVFHLLSAGDLTATQRANAHFSSDLLASLLNEPIPGHAVFWSSASDRTYPLPVRVFSFEELHAPLDPDYGRPAEDTYASRLRTELLEVLGQPTELVEFAPDDEAVVLVDPIASVEDAAVQAVLADTRVCEQLQRGGMAWGRLGYLIKDHLPDQLPDQETIAFRLIPRVLNELLGPQNESWHTAPRDGDGKRAIFPGPPPASAALFPESAPFPDGTI